VEFFETPSTNSDVVFGIIQDVHLRYRLELFYCRGQCCDGTANVSGYVTGLRIKITHPDPRAIFVHCTAHTLKLVVQNSMQKITSLRDV
jgi:hypothetical protein